MRRPLILGVFAALMAVSAAQADVFNMGGARDPVTGAWTGQASLEFVTVGDPGNAPDTRYNGEAVGAVGYTYGIGKYDVTNAQYCEFLNAKASSGDPYGLWSSRMDSWVEGGITRLGSGPYTYSVKPGYDNYPVVAVTWYDAIRFANWLQNGQGITGSGDTESGTYAISGSGPSWTVDVPSAAVRGTWTAANPHWVLPSENEWYKAAYYAPTLNGGSGGYWTYPTKSNTAPVNMLSSTGTDNANFYDVQGTGNSTYTTGSPYLTNVGAFAASPGPYGTYDQGGDVWQWNATVRRSVPAWRKNP